MRAPGPGSRVRHVTGAHRFSSPLLKCHGDPSALPGPGRMPSVHPSIHASCARASVHPCIMHTCICPCTRASVHPCIVHPCARASVRASVHPSLPPPAAPVQLHPLAEVPETQPGPCRLAGKSPGSPRSQGSAGWWEVWDAGIQPSPGHWDPVQPGILGSSPAQDGIIESFRLEKTFKIKSSR